MSTEEQKHWLNKFVEKNLWGILVTLVGVVVAYTTLSFRVQIQAKRIDNIEECQKTIVENQKTIVHLQTIQNGLIEDISEIKEDVKTLLMRN